MIDFSAVRAKQTTVYVLVKDFTVEDLRTLTNEMIDTMLDIIKECEDGDVTFQPEDPEANDTFASNSEEVNMPWTLGHLIVHATASSEESAFLAAELARGVAPREGRSRSEVYWETVTTMEQVRHRLKESRRMRLASLDLWPDNPYLDNVKEVTGWYLETVGTMNAVSRFVMGLMHDDSHLNQLRDVVQQAQRSRVVSIGY
jgi:hypothetical protein